MTMERKRRRARERKELEIYPDGYPGGESGRGDGGGVPGVRGSRDSGWGKRKGARGVEKHR